MKIVQINGGAVGSTGKIMFGIDEIAKQNGIQTMCVFPVVKKQKKQLAENCVAIGNYYTRGMSVLLARLTGLNGCFARFSTKKLLKKIAQFSPDVIHLHNLHDSYIHLPSLFRYIKKNNIRVVWTLHDCWAFTGHCAHFEMARCEKWKTGCFSCPRYREYPKSYIDRSKWLYKHKKEWFTGVKELTIVTPSKWLAGLVKQSFLKNYPVKVINNGIDLSLFKPTESDFRKKYQCENKFILLGVAFGWGKQKGLDVFIELARRLDERYQIVLVGTDENVDEKLPKNIISIHRTQNQKELAEIYTAADLFVNPTREEVFGMVNVESLACGTPVVTFNTGGSPEIIDETCGMVVGKDDINDLQKKIEKFRQGRGFGIVGCVKRAKQYDMHKKFIEYLQLYQQL